MKKLIFFLTAYVALAAGAVEDEPDELNWDTLGGTITGFSHFRDYCRANPDFRRKIIAEKPVVNVAAKPVNVNITAADFSNACVRQWGERDIDGVRCLILQSGHNGLMIRSNKNVAELANMSFAPELVAHYEYDSFGGEKMPSRFYSDGVIDFYQCNPVRYNNPIADVDVLGLRLKPEKDGRVRRYYEQVSKGVGKSSFRETYNLAAYEKAYSKFEETINEAKLFGTIDEREAVFQENELRKCCPGLRDSVLRYAHKKQEK